MCEPSTLMRAARVQRRNADQRVIQRIHHVMDNLARRHDNLVFLEAGKIVTVKLIPDLTIRSDQHFDPMRIQHIKRRHHAAIVPLFEDIRIAVQELGRNPGLHELNAILIPIGLTEHRRERRARDLAPNPVAVLLDQLNAQLAHVLRDARDARIDRMKRQQRLGADSMFRCQAPVKLSLIIGNHQLPRSPTPDSPAGGAAALVISMPNRRKVTTPWPSGRGLRIRPGSARPPLTLA
jgi:hypothetical protein